MNETERRAKATLEAAIRFARATAAVTDRKYKVRASQAAVRLVELEAEYASRYTN